MSYEAAGRPGLLRGRVINRRRLSGLNLLKMGQRAQAGWLGVAGAAASGGEQRENRGDEGGKNADHGSVRF